MVAPHLEEARKEESQRKDKLIAERAKELEKSAKERGSLSGEVRVSALGPVWEKEEEAEETRPGKLESAEETHGPAAAKREATMKPIQDIGRYVSAGQPQVRKFAPPREGQVMFAEATPSISGEASSPLMFLLLALILIGIFVYLLFANAVIVPHRACRLQATRGGEVPRAC